jgi:hypothetical protein
MFRVGETFHLIRGKARVCTGILDSLLGDLPKASPKASRKTLALQSIMSPTDAALVHRIGPTREQLPLLVRANVELLREYALRLRCRNALGVLGEETK